MPGVPPAQTSLYLSLSAPSVSRLVCVCVSEVCLLARRVSCSYGLRYIAAPPSPLLSSSMRSLLYGMVGCCLLSLSHPLFAIRSVRFSLSIWISPVVLRARCTFSLRSLSLFCYSCTAPHARAFKARYISTVSLSFAIYTTINIDIRNYDDVGYMSFSFAYCIYISVRVLFAQYIYIKKML